MRGWRGVLAGSLGLALFELVLTDKGGSGLVAGAFTYPAKWLADLVDPTKPGLPQAKASAAAQSSATSSGSVVQAGLSGTPTTTGTGSQTLPAGTLPPTYL
jgi:hypothetical protein